MSRAGWQFEREHAEPDSPSFTPFELDRYRIINCTAFRRLEQKTQVFAPAFHDHFRTRLTHTLEVANIARTLARILNANADLAEAISLAHDLGHPPFGHAGEAALNELMREHGGFNHNAHSLRVVEYLEHPYPAFRGLNLTRAVRDGLRVHETRYDRPGVDACKESETATRASAGFAFIESQIASLADRIAYDLHDLEDAIGAGLISRSDLEAVVWWRQARDGLQPEERTLPIHAVRRRILDKMLVDALHNVTANSAAPCDQPPSSAQPLALTGPGIAMTSQAAARVEALEVVLLERVYRHPDVSGVDAAGRRMITSLFHAYRGNPRALPERFASRVDDQGIDRVVCDYIAGMTDRFADAECRRIGVNPRGV